jgi:hypothetical protein
MKSLERLSNKNYRVAISYPFFVKEMLKFDFLFFYVNNLFIFVQQLTNKQEL